MDDKYQLQFVWPYREPNDVVVTGDFDGWNSSVHLERTERGFEATVPVDWNSKVRFKFRTDGWWTTIANFPTEVDALGNVNNITFTPEKPAAKTNGVIPIKEVIEAREITPAVPEAPAAVPEPASETPAVEESHPAVDTPVKTEVVLPIIEDSAEPAIESSPAAPTTNGTPLESDNVDKVEPPVAEEPEVAPAVPIVILPVAEKQADANDAQPTVDEVPSATPVPDEASVPPSTHVPAPAPEPEPVSEPEAKADASDAQPVAEVVPPSAPEHEETPAEAPSPAPAPEVTEPEPEEKTQPVVEATPAPAETPKAPSTPPRQIDQLPKLPTTPIKQINGTATSVPSTPQSGPAVSASAPATPAGKLAFPSEGRDEAGSVRSLKEGHHKHRLSFLKKIKNKIHDRLHPHHHDGTDSSKGNGHKDKEGSLFHRRSSSKY